MNSDFSIDDAIGVRQMDVKSRVSVAVARKALDAQQQAGDAAIALLKAAAETAQGSNEFGGRMDLKA